MLSESGIVTYRKVIPLAAIFDAVVVVELKKLFCRIRLILYES